MDDGDTARAFYDSARAEIIERIGHRDNVLILYLGAIGAIYSVYLGTDASLDLLLAIPFLAVGAAVIVSQHHAVIGQIGNYLSTELHPYFMSLDGDTCPPQWDTSKSCDSYHKKALNQRFCGHILLVVVPAVPGLLFTRAHALHPLSPVGVLWWIGAVFIVLAAWVITAVHIWRLRLRMLDARSLHKPVTMWPNQQLEPETGEDIH